MNSYERVVAVLNGGIPDRVPTFELMIDLNVMKRATGTNDYMDMCDILDMDVVVTQTPSRLYREVVVDEKNHNVQPDRGARAGAATGGRIHRAQLEAGGDCPRSGCRRHTDQRRLRIQDQSFGIQAALRGILLSRVEEDLRLYYRKGRLYGQTQLRRDNAHHRQHGGLWGLHDASPRRELWRQPVGGEAEVSFADRRGRDRLPRSVDDLHPRTGGGIRQGRSRVSRARRPLHLCDQQQHSFRRQAGKFLAMHEAVHKWGRYLPDGQLDWM